MRIAGYGHSLQAQSGTKHVRPSMSALGQSLPSHRGPVQAFVRC
jgi:hypothetical protein